MKYGFLERSDEDLLEAAGMSLDGGAAIALFTTGYDVENDETVSLSIVGFDGSVQFDCVVKPHNLDEWAPSDASGGITPQDVEDKSALYEFEDDIMEVLEGTEFIVAQHVDFMTEMFDRSWIAVPATKQYDLLELFRMSHCDSGRPGEPATVASLPAICEYYGIECDLSSTAGCARALIDGYRAYVKEHADARDAKGADYWDAYEKKRAEENAIDERALQVQRMRTKRLNQMNGLLWIAGAIIFTSLCIQLVQRGYDMGFVAISAAAAVFTLVRGIINLKNS